MPLTTAGVTAMAKAVLGESQTLFNNANAHVGAGNGTTVFAASQTDLQGASKTRKAMDTGYPTALAALATNFRATFATGDANFAWDEWAIFNAATAGDMLTRKVEALGTKTSAQSWQFTGTITFSAA